jgi:glutathione S-transferase
MLRWARMKEVNVPEPLPAFYDRMEARPAVQLALQHEGLA